ncbi:hypothetical protein V9T40_014701 [Parthenolecanium corni]|uniref:Alpha-mannosidase n=1 Tax=Parthenolecanium corni TaxID=536013 RepID=A0AAN9T693_9HEMI
MNKFHLNSNSGKSPAAQYHFSSGAVRSIRKTDYAISEFKKTNTCDDRTSSPSYDIQMLNLYNELEFDNPYGGPWTQGWNVQITKGRWNPSNKLKVFLVPHSHNDPGWRKTFEQYYESQTRQIFNNMIVKLAEDPRRKFIWAEVSFLSLWWAETSESSRNKFKEFIQNGQVEIVSGGWVMPDEANSHYYSIIQELTHGHQWLEKHLNYKPKRSWCIDPFGTSPTMPYILQHFGVESLVIQRTHYSVKKYLAKNKQLEFRWRQIWDGSGKFDFMTHMMPFFIYDIPHTCGPDPSICCQFDFRRPSAGLFCPWKKQPQTITDKNVAFRAQTLLDQYKKKAELYSTNVLLVPLGDDFRFDVTSEWDQQYINYQKLFDYMNNNPELYVEAKFGTLEDYFEALLTEKQQKQFPSLSGDFFTYADRDDHYWSGYFTSRPYYKRMDRELISHLRSAEILHAIAWKSAPFHLSKWLLTEDSGFIELLRNARSNLSLFQHHDGITGTAKDFVVDDYALKLIRSMKGAEHVMQQSLNFLLRPDKQNFVPDSDAVYFELTESRKTPENGAQKMLKVTESVPVKRLVIFNPLTWNRTEILEVRLGSYKNVILVDENDHPVKYQISPFCEINDLSQSCYLMHFEVRIRPLSVTTLFLKYKADTSNSENLASLNILNDQKMSQLKDIEKFLKYQPIISDFSVENSQISVTFRPDGLMKAVTLKNRDLTVSVHLSFIGYGCKRSKEMCGAYLFLPDGHGRPIECAQPRIKIIEGKLVSSVTVFCDFVIHQVKIYNCLGSEENIIELQNLVDIRNEHNFEIAMKLSTSIKNQETFYTDLNGFQIIKRQFFSKLPLQGNYYPVPSSIYIEDDDLRLTLVSAQPLGGGSLSEGEIEIMQDRRLNQDDNLGLGQGILDNRPILHIFRLTLEKRIANCRKAPNSYPAGHLSVISYLTMNTILYPLMLFAETDDELESEDLRSSFTMEQLSRTSEIDIHLVSGTSIPETSSVGLVLHRTELDTCFQQEYEHYPLSDGLVNISAYIPFSGNHVIRRSSLSFLQIDDKLNTDSYPLCFMDLTAFYITNSSPAVA